MNANSFFSGERILDVYPDILQLPRWERTRTKKNRYHTFYWVPDRGVYEDQVNIIFEQKTTFLKFVQKPHHSDSSLLLTWGRSVGRCLFLTWFTPTKCCTLLRTRYEHRILGNPVVQDCSLFISRDSCFVRVNHSRYLCNTLQAERNIDTSKYYY